MHLENIRVASSPARIEAAQAAGRSFAYFCRNAHLVNLARRHGDQAGPLTVDATKLEADLSRLESMAHPDTPPIYGQAEALNRIESKIEQLAHLMGQHLQECRTWQNQSLPTRPNNIVQMPLESQA
jgi:hypothetical protein